MNISYPWTRNTPLAELEEIMDNYEAGAIKIAKELKQKNEEMLRKLKNGK